MTTMKELSESVSSLCDMLAEYNGRLISLENKLRKLKEETNGTKPNKAREQIPTQGKLSEMQK
tara:strand:- start:1 stop:189 length:189 start_codon:yes stop_codon:yes gene_type:complete